MKRHLSAMFIKAKNKNELTEKLEILFNRVKYQRYINRIVSKAIKCVKNEIIEGTIKKVDGLYYFDKYLEDIISGNYFQEEDCETCNSKLDKLCNFFGLNYAYIMDLYENDSEFSIIINSIYQYALLDTMFIILINHDITRHGTYDFECITDSRYAELRESFNDIVRNIDDKKYDWLYTCNNFYDYTYDNPDNDKLVEIDIINGDNIEE